MHILIVLKRKIPATTYGGAQRVVWWLGKELTRRGHEVTYIAEKGSTCPFAKIIPYNPTLDLNKQIPKDVDIVNIHHSLEKSLEMPYLSVFHSTPLKPRRFAPNTVFISQNHAQRHNSNHFIYHGLDPQEYGIPDFNKPRNYLHFLARASWNMKNLKGAIHIAKKSGHRLEILGGHRLSLDLGFRCTLSPHAHFNGVVGGIKKNQLINGSKALLFPVTGNENFGLALIESLYFGCPVLGTPYGALPEIVTPDVGFLSSQKRELIKAVKNVDSYNRKRCHQYVLEHFTSKQMTDNYLHYFEKVLNGETLNDPPPYYSGQIQEINLPFE